MAFFGPKHRRSPHPALEIRVLAAVVAIAATIFTPSFALAQDVDAEVEELVEGASDDYENLEMEAAREKLERAIEKGTSGDASDDVLAEAYVMLGVAIYGATRNESDTLDAFKNAVNHDSDVELPSVYETPDLTELLEKARSSVPPDDTDESESSEPAREVDEFTHEPIESAQAGETLSVEAFVPSDLSVDTVYFVFKRYEEDEWHQVELEATDATRFAGEVPGYRIYTSQISYYLDAVNASGEVVAQSGDDDSPHSMTVLGSSDFDPQKAKDEYMAKQREKEEGADDDDDGEGEDGKDDESDTDGGRRGSPPVVYIDVGGGSGVGFLPGGTPTANPDRAVEPGVAPAFGHALLGGGYHFPNGAELGFYLRWQFSPAQDFARIQDQNPDRVYTGFSQGECLGTGLPGDCLFGLKYRWFFPNPPGIRPFASVGGGVGRVRHWLRLKERADKDFCDDRRIFEDRKTETAFCYRRDTVRPGIAHIGVGSGIRIDINETFGLLGEAYLQVLFPETAVNLDLNVGPQVRF